MGDEKPFWKRLHETNWLQPLISLTSLIIAVFGILLSIFAGCRASKSQHETLGYLKSLDSLFADANKQLSLLPNSVTAFRETVKGMSDVVGKERQTFQGVFSNLDEWLATLKTTFVSYDTVLGKVVKAMDKQLDFLNQKQAALEKELLRKPNLTMSILEIAPDTVAGRFEILLQINNTGDLIVDNCKVVLYVPEEFEFKSQGFRKYRGTQKPESWSFAISDWIPYETTPGKIVHISPPEMKFSIKIPKGQTNPFTFDYSLYHNRGSQPGKLQF